MIFDNTIQAFFCILLDWTFLVPQCRFILLWSSTLFLCTVQMVSENRNNDITRSLLFSFRNDDITQIYIKRQKDAVHNIMLVLSFNADGM